MVNCVNSLRKYTCESFPSNLYLCYLPCHSKLQLSTFFYSNNIGESILHLWIEKLREFLQVKIPVCTPVEEASESEPEQRFYDDINLEEECPEITSATPFCDRKSTFQGHAATVTRPEQVKYDAVNIIHQKLGR